MAQLENIEAIEKRLWSAADTLRANSNYASNEYFLPLMGLIFLRHAYNRFLKVKEEIEEKLPSRGGKKRPLIKEDFSQKGAIFLRKEAQYDYLVSLADSEDRAQALINAMKSIEEDYSNLKGVLPMNEYQELDKVVLGDLLRILNPDELKRASGDIFGRIYEYFLTQFADLKAHDNGEFFTPVSLVSLIANVLEPEKGVVLDPACGSGGMFVQSANFLEKIHENPTEKLTFYGMEKNQTTIRLAKMNLAVHGLEGNISRAITYYEDPHELYQKADFVMANPPFNVDEVDADKIKRDPRLHFGLPGENKKGKISNGNYLWISYFHGYLNEKGRAGFVMSSQASSAGNKEAEVRRRIVETGDVEVMIAIRSNFFYTRTVPCELWFFNRSKPEEHKDKVLMLDARNIYREVTRKIYDFSPEQLQNILSIIWLYRGQKERYLNLVYDYIGRSILESRNCFNKATSNDESVNLIANFEDSKTGLEELIMPFIEVLEDKSGFSEDLNEYREESDVYKRKVEEFQKLLHEEDEKQKKRRIENELIVKGVNGLEPMVNLSHSLIGRANHLYKLLRKLIDLCEETPEIKEKEGWKSWDVKKAGKALDEDRQKAVDQLRKVRYYYKQAIWLIHKFPKGKLEDVAGLVKLVDVKEIKKQDWSLTPGRYVGVAPEEVDEDFDFEERLREIHNELEDLNEEAKKLFDIVIDNFKEFEL